MIKYNIKVYQCVFILKHTHTVLKIYQKIPNTKNKSNFLSLYLHYI